MKIEYEDGTLRIENALGLRWQLNDVGKPEFTFSYDALSVTEQHAVRRVRGSVYPLAEAEAGEVRDFVRAPESAGRYNLAKASGRGSAGICPRADQLCGIAAGVRRSTGCNDNRPGQDPRIIYAEEARRVLTYVDAVWNAYYGLAAQIRNTPEAELTSAKEYAGTMPFPPAMEHFSNVLPEELFDAAQRNR